LHIRVSAIVKPLADPVNRDRDRATRAGQKEKAAEILGEVSTSFPKNSGNTERFAIELVADAYSHVN
jgi:hypothetical protein